MDKTTVIEPLKAYGGNHLYGFGIRKWSNGALVAVEASRSLPDADAAPTTLILQLNPTSIQQDEPAATGFAPTLGGIGVESRGNLYKECTITGDVGFLPRVAEQRLDREARAMHSGYAEFLRLRNMFRRYWMYKAGNTAAGTEASSPRTRSEIVFVFYNGKDNEVWICEPMSFQMPSRRGLKYQYNIRLRLLDAADTENITNDPVLHSTERIPFGKVARIRAALDKANDKLTEALRVLPYLTSSIAAVTESIATVTEGLDEIARTGTTAVTALRDATSDLLVSSRELVNAAARLAQIPADVMEMSIATWEAACEIAADTRLIAQSVATRYASIYNARTERSVEISDAAGRYDPTDPGMPSGVTYTDVQDGDTIFDIAQRELGDMSRWPEIVALNDLQAPYIVTEEADRAPGVAVYKDKLLLPSSATPTVGAVFDATRFERNGDATVVAFGTDLARSETGDLILDRRNGLQIIQGEENLNQAVDTKLRTEQGTLPLHPWFGFSGLTGRPGTVQTVLDTRVNLARTLKSDRRIASLDELRVDLDRDTITVTARVRVHTDSMVRNFERSL